MARIKAMLPVYRCKNCGTSVRWSEGYCGNCLDIPERRCLDCGATTRAGTLDWAYPDPSPTWQPYREAFAAEGDWEPKPPKPDRPREYRNLVKRVVPGPCLACGSLNLGRLTFGLDRLPEGQRQCSAWPNLATEWLWRGYSTWLEKAANDHRIKPKLCASCRRPLYNIKASGKAFGARLTLDGMGIRYPRVTHDDGRWSQDHARPVHAGCPDPPPEIPPHVLVRSQCEAVYA